MHSLFGITFILMIGFLVTLENIYRNEHITPVFKILIFNPNYWNLAAGYARTCTCRLSQVKFPGAVLGGIKRGLRHGQIFEILICLSIETKKSVYMSVFTHLVCYASNIVSNTNILTKAQQKTKKN